MLQRKLRHLACTVAASAIATAGLTLAGTKPVLAEFQIQEAGIEKGEVEPEYRGAYHWGVPQVTDNNENANDLIQSHELEFSMGINDWWLIQVTSGFEQPLGDNLPVFCPGADVVRSYGEPLFLTERDWWARVLLKR